MATQLLKALQVVLGGLQELLRASSTGASHSLHVSVGRPAEMPRLQMHIKHLRAAALQQQYD